MVSMKQNFILKESSVHLWRVFIPELLSQVELFSQLLNPAEMERANRFRFDIHRNRYIIARAVLRQILSLYTDVPAEEVAFSLGEYGKPYLRDNPLDLQFNLSHSHDLAVYAIVKQCEIGIDIEKMEDEANDALAQRFFNEQEYQQFLKLPEVEKMTGFYAIWAAKEALIKAKGEGFFAAAKNQQSEEGYHLVHFDAHPGYQAAFATKQSIAEIVCWQWTVSGPLQQKEFLSWAS